VFSPQKQLSRSGVRLFFFFPAIGSHGQVGDLVAVLEPPSSIHSAPADKIATHASGRGNFTDAKRNSKNATQNQNNRHMS